MKAFDYIAKILHVYMYHALFINSTVLSFSLCIIIVINGSVTAAISVVIMVAQIHVDCLFLSTCSVHLHRILYHVLNCYLTHLHI